MVVKQEYNVDCETNLVLSTLIHQIVINESISFIGKSTNFFKWILPIISINKANDYTSLRKWNKYNYLSLE